MGVKHTVADAEYYITNVILSFVYRYAYNTCLYMILFLEKCLTEAFISQNRMKVRRERALVCGKSVNADKWTNLVASHLDEVRVWH